MRINKKYFTAFMGIFLLALLVGCSEEESSFESKVDGNGAIIDSNHEDFNTLSGNEQIAQLDIEDAQHEADNEASRLERIEVFKQGYAERELLYDDGTPIDSEEDMEILDYIDSVSIWGRIFENEVGSADYFVEQAEMDSNQLFEGSNGVGMLEEDAKLISTYTKELKEIKPHKDYKEYHEKVIQFAEAHLNANKVVLKAVKKESKKGLLEAREELENISTLRVELVLLIREKLGARNIYARDVYAFPTE